MDTPLYLYSSMLNRIIQQGNINRHTLLLSEVKILCKSFCPGVLFENSNSHILLQIYCRFDAKHTQVSPDATHSDRYRNTHYESAYTMSQISFSISLYDHNVEASEICEPVRRRKKQLPMQVASPQHGNGKNKSLNHILVHQHSNRIRSVAGFYLK